MQVPKPIKLTLKQIKENARRYYRAGALQFQRYTNTSSQCSYSAPCVIGASMPKEMRAFIESDGWSQMMMEDNTSIEFVMQKGFVKVPAREKEAVCKLQEVHDRLVGENDTDNLSYFLKLIDYKSSSKSRSPSAKNAKSKR